MPYVASIGTYLPCWCAPLHRVAGDDAVSAVTILEGPANGAG